MGNLQRHERGLAMIRQIWLAIICLAVLSTFALGKAVMTRAVSLPGERPVDLTSLGTDSTQEALGKADRLKINYVREEIPAAPVFQSTEPAVPDIASPPPEENKIISRHWRDPNASSPVMKPKPVKQTDSGRNGKIVDRKGNQAAGRSRPAQPPKPCSRPGAVGDLLRSLNLSPACES